MHTIIADTEDKTKSVASQLAKHLSPGDIICLYGDLGAGKTTFVKGVAKQFRIKECNVNSPTYVILNIYPGKTEVYHFDFYRLENLDQIHTTGFEEFLYGDGISFVEWPERLGNDLPKEYLKVNILHRKQGGRTIKISAKGTRYKEVLGKLN
ncbi:MAG: tRNA threonylcarbamoyladenosine biosynthesis protein TsaE [Lysobacterales bacterium]|jgi:tRNA threonylcarbamoyladenosine biosynthesis protein TsaE